MAPMSVAENVTIWSRNAWLVVTSTKIPRITTETAKMPAKSAERRKPSVRRNLIRTQGVSRATHGVDQFGAMAAVYLGAQPAHMGLHDIGARIEVKVPNIFQQH